MKTILDVDYYDLCLEKQGDAESLKRLFHDAKSAGFDSMMWAPLACGKALYPSRHAKQFRDSGVNKGAEMVAENLDRFDPLAEAASLAREFGLELLFYFRLFDDFWPGLEADYLDSRPHLWWQSRCGHYQYRGYPCYHQPEVRDYKMRLFKELLAYGPSGFVIEAARSHAAYVDPHRSSNFFGYDIPVAEEYQKRYGIDIRKFDYTDAIGLHEPPFERVAYSYSTTYVNPAEFDLDAWHWLKGESVDSFIRELRAAHPGGQLLLQGGLCPPHPGAVKEGASALYHLDANKLAVDKVIDGYSYSLNWKTWELGPEYGDVDSTIERFFFPWFQGVQDAGAGVGGWLNDIFSGDSPNEDLASPESVRNYARCVCEETSLDYVIIHEAELITRNEQSDAIWEALREFKN